LIQPSYRVIWEGGGTNTKLKLSTVQILVIQRLGVESPVELHVRLAPRVVAASL